MPGRISATVSGRRGGGQIWLTVRRTGCFFFFHRVRSFRGFPGPGILGTFEIRPWMQAHRVLPCLGTLVPCVSLRAAPHGPGGAPRRGQASSEVEHAHLRSPRREPKPCQFFGVIWAPCCRLREGRVFRLPLAKKWNGPSPWRRDANGSGASSFLF